MVLAATPNQHSSGQRRACSTSTIDNESMALHDAVSFRTIRTDINGPFLHSKCYIAAATHDEEVRCGAGGHPKSTHHQDRDELVAPPPSIMRAWL